MIVKNSLLYVYSSFPDDDVISIKPRLVNNEEFERVKKQFSEWFISYEATEGPYLREMPNNK